MRRMMIMHDHATNMQPLADLINDKKTDSSDLQPVPLKVLWIIFCKVCCHLFGTTIKIAPESEKEGKGFDDSMALSYILYHFIQWYANDMPSEILPPPATQLHLQRTLRSCQVWGRLEMAMSSAALCSPPRGCPSFGNRGSTHIWEGFVGQILQNLGWN